MKISQNFGEIDRDLKKTNFEAQLPKTTDLENILQY